MITFAESLGVAVSFMGKVAARGAVLASVAGGRCHIRLHAGLPDETNLRGIARGLAQWDVGRGGCVVDPARGVERLALSIAMPLEAMQWFHREGTDAAGIAKALLLPLDFVEARERAFVKLCSVRRLPVAAEVDDESAASAG